MSLNPSFAVAHYSLGYTLYLTGREPEAMRSCDTAIRLSPLDPMAFAFHCIKAHILCFDGSTDQALHHARRIADHPNVHAFALAVAAWVNEICGDAPAAMESSRGSGTGGPATRRRITLRLFSTGAHGTRSSGSAPSNGPSIVSGSGTDTRDTQHCGTSSARRVVARCNTSSR